MKVSFDSLNIFMITSKSIPIKSNIFAHRQFLLSALPSVSVIFSWVLFFVCTYFTFLLVHFLSFYSFFWRRKWQPTPVFLPGESHGWRGLVGCGLWDCKESDTTKQLTHTQPSYKILCGNSVYTPPSMRFCIFICLIV